MESFFKEAIGTFKTSGTIRPSSKYLINNCLKRIDFSDAKVIIEFGAGDGCITNEILQRISPTTRLISFEINPKFYAHCESKFKNYPNFTITDHSAFEFVSLLECLNIQQVDYIISSLPLALFKDREVDLLLQKIAQTLSDSGRFVQYQYSLNKYRALKEIFDKVDIDLTIRNIPPAFIYQCSNK